jgi:hypothetical protein
MNATLPLKERILAAAAATSSPTRREGRRLTAWLVGLSAAIGLVIFELAGGIGHARHRPLLLTVRLADGWGLAAAWLTWVVARQSAPRVQSKWLLSGASIAGPVLLCAWAYGFHGLYEQPPACDDWPCFALTLLFTAAPLACFLGIKRGIEPDYPATLGAAAGTMCGAWAGVLALLWCPSTDLLHIAIGHALPIALSTAVGLVVGRHALRARGWRTWYFLKPTGPAHVSLVEGRQREQIASNLRKSAQGRHMAQRPQGASDRKENDHD